MKEKAVFDVLALAYYCESPECAAGATTIFCD